ncbi:MAG TPA: ParB/RepB/Spo0J family partition protein [Anaerolineae bacterium]|nr:ParB/RepB/Spo0J family partition protein [Anaerolineae bacterium]
MTQQTVTEVPVALIDPGDNDREAFDPTGLRELAASIAEHGLAQPITVRPMLGGRYQIVAGERRWRAHQLLQRVTIPALVRSLSDEQASGIMLLENIHRAELNPIEEARAYRKRMTQFGWDEERLAREANVPAGRVRLRLALLDIVPEAQDLVKAGQMGVKYAYVLRDLDVNRQRIALRYLAEVDTPRIREFRKLCARLLEEQAQEAMFDMAAFMTTVQDARDAEAAARPERIIPVVADLPAMRKARSTAQALERYIRDLLDGGYEEAAAVVGTAYRGLLQHQIVQFPQGASPLIPGETLADQGRA